LGVSSARVTQLLQVLSLAPAVLKFIAAPGDPLPLPIETERKLRPVFVNLQPEEQRPRVEAILAGSSRKSLEKRTPNPNPLLKISLNLRQIGFKPSDKRAALYKPRSAACPASMP
jgi:hypothetical protein